MKFSILHPSARPDQWRAVYDAWLKAAEHPENVEYILVIDERWGFVGGDPLDPFYITRGDGPSLNRLLWSNAPYKHSGYVSAMNQAAAAATGDVLIGIADDLFPPDRWDEQIENLIERTRDTAPAGFDSPWWEYEGEEADEGAQYSPKKDAEFVVWAPTGTPREWERDIAVIQIESRSRFKRLGYLFYPGYESMYADNDFVEHARADAAAGRCAFIKSEITFDHRHWLNNKRQADTADEQQSHADLYREGYAILEKRRAAGFPMMNLDSDQTRRELRAKVTPQPAPHVERAEKLTTTRRRIHVILSGELFYRRWVMGLVDLLGNWCGKHDLTMSYGYTPNVYMTRCHAAREALKMQPPPDYILWVDDDQPPFGAELLLHSIENSPKEVGMVAGWTLTAEGNVSFGVVEQGKRTWVDKEWYLGPENTSTHSFADWTGFPMAIMRRELLADVGAEAFLPRKEGVNEWGGHVGEDMGFCAIAREKGWLIGIDKRVHLEHLKVVDVAQIK